MESERDHRSNSNNKEEEEEDHEMLKRRISSHPLYQHMLEQHFNCLKVSEISKLEKVEKKKDKKKKKAIMKKRNSGMFCESELDLFMEAYCIALGKLKEAMEEPQLKSMAFINNMHSQLTDLTQPSSSSSSSLSNFPPHPSL